jgi:hypothetical protein
MGMPIFPTRRTSGKMFFRIAAVNEEVVLFPFVPVIPTIFPGHSAKKIFVADVR